MIDGTCRTHVHAVAKSDNAIKTTLHCTSGKWSNILAIGSIVSSGVHFFAVEKTLLEGAVEAGIARYFLASLAT